MAGLQSVRIQRFKGVEDAQVDLGALNVLVGANNSGKSSIIQGLHFAVAVLQTIALEYNWSNKLPNLVLSLNPNLLIYSPTNDVDTLGLGGTLRQKEESQIKFELILASGEKIELGVRKGRNRNLSITLTNPIDAQRLSSLEAPFTIFSPGLAGISKSESWVSDGVLLRTLARGDANLVLRNTLFRLWGTEEWDLLKADLHEVFPDLDLAVEFREKTDEHISVDVTIGGVVVPLELAGTGVLQTIQILSYIHSFSPKMIVLDEPDSHLHPNNQRLLCTLLETIASERGTQIILTTHSRHVIDAVGPASNFLWVRDGTVDPVSMEDEIGVLLNIGALDVKERISDASTKAIVLTEDTNSHLLKRLLASSGWPEEGTAVLEYNGVTKIKNLIPLINQVRAGNPGSRLVLHRDRDYLTDGESADWERKVRNQHVIPFLTKGIDVESHFLNPAYLGKSNPEAGEEWFVNAFEVLKLERRDSLIENYVNGRTQVLREQGLGSKINPGKIAAEAVTALAAESDRFSLGKSFLKALRARYSDEFKTSLQLPTGADIADPDLQFVAKRIPGGAP